MSRQNVRVFDNPQDLAEGAARVFVEEAREAIETSGRFAVALAGGSTPKRAYGILATEYRDAIEWDRTHVFFGDERAVPPDHEDSNYRMAREALISRVPVESVYRIRGELEPEEAAALYEEELTVFFGGPPIFDLVLLGIGEDGHTASLFPRTPALDAARDRWVIANPVEKLGTTRITLTVPTLNAARKVAFLVAGEGKAEALKEILEGNADPRDYPAKLVQSASEPEWLVDPTAARLLDWKGERGVHAP